MIKLIASIAVSVIALMAGAAQASILTSELDGVVINGVTYNVTFSQNSTGLTAFNDVFGTGSPTLTFTTQSDAATATTAVRNSVISHNFDVTPGGSFNEFALPFSYTVSRYSTYIAWANDQNFDGIFGPFDSDRTDSSYMGSFATFAIAVPEPESYAMLLAGLGLMGFAARRRKTRAA